MTAGSVDSSKQVVATLSQTEGKGCNLNGADRPNLSISPEPPSTQSESTEFSLLELLTSLAHYKKLVLRWMLVGGVSLGGLSFVMKPEYTAFVTLLPPQQSGSGSSALAQLSSIASLGGGGSLGIKNPVDMYVALMQSTTVLDAMVRRYHLQDEYGAKRFSDARAVFESNVSIEANPKDGLIRLSLSDHNPNRAAELANGYVEQYRALSSTLAVGEAAQRRLFFEQQLELEKNKLAAAEEDLKRTQQSTGLVEIDSQARALIQQTAALRAQINAKEVQLSSLRVYAAPSNTDLQQTEQELATLRSALARVEGKDSESSDLNVNQKLPQAGLEFVRKTREVKYHSTLFEILARQFEAAKLDEAREGSTIQVVDMATIPDHRTRPKRLYYILGGIFAGTLIGMLVALYKAAIQRNSRMSERVRNLKQALRS